MNLSFSLKNDLYPTDIRIIPDEAAGENPDRLSQIAMQLPDIKNPAVGFADAAKAGYYNGLTDEQYEALLYAVKCLGKQLWMDDDGKVDLLHISVFDLLIHLLNFFLERNMSDYIRDNLIHFPEKH